MTLPPLTIVSAMPVELKVLATVLAVAFVGLVCVYVEALWRNR